MGRLHLGGGTPTILPAQTMTKLLDAVFAAFAPSQEFEFSVEIDPTEASEDLLVTLIKFGMNRASIGVQDFDPKVQAAIGREQSLEQTLDVVQFLRKHGIAAINLDLLYGLPFQTAESFRQTLAHVVEMDADCLAIYGYAHVPWMSKRQVLIKEETLPDTQQRYALAQMAQAVLDAAGYAAIGIDHFAKPTDSLFNADQNGTLRPNFQGYTDDQSQTLVGLGASAISRFRQGYQQNAAATSAYQERITQTGFAGHKGYEMSGIDHMIATIIEELMCSFRFPTAALQEQFPEHNDALRQTAVSLMTHYPDVFRLSTGGLEMVPAAYPLVRVIASFVDRFTTEEAAHAAAI
jgi:oxygen-independent coproporphyrinogen-3 oxidase